MKNLSMKYILLLIIVACLFSQESYSRGFTLVFKTDTSIIKNMQKKEVANNYFDSLLRSIDCDDTNADVEIKSIQSKIEAKLNSMLKKLREYKKETLRTPSLIIALDRELKTYKNHINNEASTLFWAYGVSSMQGERVVSRNCYYLSALKREYFFVNAINEKIEGALFMNQ